MGDSLLSKDSILVELAIRQNSPLAIARVGKAKSKFISEKWSLVNSILNEEWLTSLLDDLGMRSVSHLEQEMQNSQSCKVPVRIDPENKLLGNFGVWSIVKEASRRIDTYASTGGSYMQRAKQRIETAVKSMTTRYAAALGEETWADGRNLYVENIDAAACYLSLAEGLRSLYKDAAKYYNSNMAEYRKCIKYFDEFKPVGYTPNPEKVKAQVWILGSLVAIRLGKVSVVYRHEHFERTLKLLELGANLLIGQRELNLAPSVGNVFEELIDILWPLITTDVESVGEVLKGVRGTLIMMLDKDALLGRNLRQEFLKTMKPFRRMWVECLLPPIYSLCRTLPDAINFVNVYRGVPHPDVNLHEVFDTISGVKEPNRANPQYEERFKGTLRRALYKSLHSQGYHPRVTANQEAGAILESITSATQVDIRRILRSSHTSWSCVQFLPVRGIPNIREMVVAPSSKASQIPVYYDADEFSDALRWSMGERMNEPKIIQEAKTVNDIVTELTGSSYLGSTAAIKRFELIIKLHEHFEKKYPGLPPEDIPSEDLAEFIKTNPNAAYFVGTEPKFGEVHKKVTRMFYMAEQQLKTITQRIERLAKQISRKQSGVSIVKSYAGRRKDLESFARAMTGDTPMGKSIFVSFDMSEFSKKFPMNLVRAFGGILAEMTGESWLSRIDLIFRATVVLHNSRGYFSYLSGVKGGFEGFLNFVWSSIHAVIMEISLEATGLSGDLLTFSDDGLLMLSVPDDLQDDELWRRLMAIQRVYSQFGLEFNLGKTLISTKVWEYLGDVCFNNHLLPMWMKELTAINKSTLNSGINTVYSRLKALEGQSEAMITSGGCPMLAYILKRLYAGLRIQKFLGNLHPDVEEAILITPSRAGGLRIRSPLEGVIFSTINIDAEFIADLHLYKKSNPAVYSLVSTWLIGRMRVESDELKTVVSGSVFATSTPRTSGRGVCVEAIEQISQVTAKANMVVSNPISSTVGDSLRTVLRAVNNIDLVAISSLIHSTPDWRKYTDCMALVQSSGALKLLPRSELKKLQAKDTKNIKDAGRLWILTYEDTFRVSISPHEMYTTFAGKMFPTYRVAPYKPSPRYTLCRTIKASDIEVRTDVEKCKTMSDASYVEPPVNFPSDITTIAWYSEVRGDPSSRAVRKFVETIARFLTSNPGAVVVISQLALAIGVVIPVVPVGIMRGLHRRQEGLGGTPDVRVVLPRAYDALTSSRYVEATARYVFTLEHADRSTNLQYARAIAYGFWKCGVSSWHTIPSHILITHYMFRDGTVEHSHKREPMTMDIPILQRIRGIERNQIPEREFTSTILEFSEYAELANSIDKASRSGGYLDEDESLIIRELTVRSLARWAASAVNERHNTIVTDSPFPLPQSHPRTAVIQASIDASVQLLAPMMRRRLLDKVNAYYLYSLTDEKFEELVSTDEYKMFLRWYQGVIAVFAAAGFAGVSEDDLYRTCVDHKLLTGGLLVEMIRYVPFVATGLTVLRTPGFPVGKFSPAHKNAFRKAFTNTISMFTEYGKKVNWDTRRIKAEFPGCGDPDDFLDMLFLFRTILRPSEHRSISHPYNVTTAMITLHKFYMFLKSCLSLNGGKATKEDLKTHLDTWTPHRFEEITLVRLYKRSITGGELGPDHLAVASSSLSSEVFPRVCLHLATDNRGVRRKIGSAGRRDYNVSASLIRQLQTSFYTYIIRAMEQSMVTYPSTLETFLANSTIPENASMKNYYESNTSISVLKLIPHSYKGSDLDDNLIALLGSHLREFAIREHLSGFKLSGNYSKKFEDALYDSHMSGQNKLVDGTKDGLETGEITALVLSYPKRVDAFMAYTTLQLSGRMCGSVFYCPESRMTHVVCVIKFFRLVPIGTYTSEMRQQYQSQADLFVPTMPATKVIEAVQQNVDRVVRPSVPPKEMTHKLGIVQRYARIAGFGRSLINDNPVLQAAYELMHEDVSSQGIFGAYVLFTAYLLNMEKPSMITRLHRKILNDMKDFKMNGKYRSDVAMVKTYLVNLRLTAAINSDMSQVLALRECVATRSVPYVFGDIGTTMKYREPDSIKELVKDVLPKELVGNVLNYLFEPPKDLLRIEDVNTDVEEDEEADSDFEAMFE